MSTDEDIIDRLGGTVAVAADLPAPATTVSSWKSSGIPPWRHDAVLALAGRKGVALDRQEFAKQERRPGEQADAA